MALDINSYVLAKKYTDETAIQFGGLKGAPCKVKTITKENGRTTITLEWENNEGDIRQSEFYVDDACSVWESEHIYEINDIVYYDGALYICTEGNSDPTFNPNKWDIISGGEDPGQPAELTSEITATKTVGGVTSGDHYGIGTPLEDVIRDIIAPVLYPVFTNPSASISATGNKLLETGSSLNTTITATFNRGTINPAYGTSGKRSGVAIDYSLNGATAQSGNTFNVTVTSSQLTYQVTVNYEAGEQPKDSAGRNYSSPLPAGSVTSNIITYEFVDALWANTSNINTIAKLGLVSKSTKQKDLVFPAQTIASPEVFDVPASWNVTAIQVKNDLSGAFENAADQFTATTVTHNDAAGNTVNYNRYTFNLGYDTGSRTVRIKWS